MLERFLLNGNDLVHITRTVFIGSETDITFDLFGSQVDYSFMKFVLWREPYTLNATISRK